MLLMEPVRVLLLALCTVQVMLQDAPTTARTSSTWPHKRRGWRRDGQRSHNLDLQPEAIRNDRERWRNVVGRAGINAHREKKDPSYVVLAPTVARPNSVYRVVVGVLRDEGGPVSVRAVLATDSDNEITQGQEVLQPPEMKTIMMQVPGGVEVGSGGSLRLRVEGHKGSQLVFTNTTHVATTPRFLIVLVQMSRGVYSGGMPVEFSVVLLKLDLTPYEGPVDVYILDTDGYVLRRWVSRFPDVGVVRLVMKSPGLPKPGMWRVRVVVGGQVDEHYFPMMKYFPPRYEVMVEMPFFTLASEGTLRGRFVARFLSYKPVPGRANVTVLLKDDWQLPDSAFTEVHKEILPEVNGWREFQYPLKTIMGNMTSDMWRGEVMVRVNYYHNFYGDKATGTSRTRITSPQVKLEFLGSEPLVFKPGMSFSGAVAVRYEDGDPLDPARLQQSTLSVTASVSLASGDTRSLPRIVAEPLERERRLGERLREEWFWGNVTGNVAEELLEALVHHTVFASYRKSGILQFSMDIPEEVTGMELSATYQDPKGSASARAAGVKAHTSGGRYLHVTTSTTNASIGEFAIFHVRANFRMDKFQYLVMAKGVLVHSAWWRGTGSVATLSITVAREMCPRFTLVVVHVTPDGHVLVDAVHVSVSFHTNMKNKLLLNQHKDHSMRTVEAAMWAPPGSYMSITCTRIPSWYKQQANRLTHAKLLKAALRMEAHPRAVHTVTHTSRTGEWKERITPLSNQNTGVWALDSLHLAGLTILTNALLTSPPLTGGCDLEAGFLECGDGSCYRQSEVCDGRVHCANAADELHCLTVAREQHPEIISVDRVEKTPESELEEYRLKQRSWWRDLYDQRQGDWCITQQHFGHKGYERVDLTLPNSPSQWMVEGFVTHPDHGISLLPEREYDATPPVFLTLEAPVICRRGEQISVRAVLANGMREEVLVLVMVPASKHYRFVHVEPDATVSHYRPRLSSGDHQHLVMLKAQEYMEVLLPLAVTLQSGTFKVTVHALSQVGSQTRTITIKVLPEGVEVRKHTSVLLDLKNRATVYEFMDVPVDQSPEITKSIIRRYVYGSPKASVSLSGDVFGPTLSNVEISYTKAFNGRVLKSTDGISFNFGATVWTLHYLRLTNQLNVGKAKKAFESLNVNLAGLLTRYKKGAFKMWHASKPSVWLTAWVVNLLLAAQHEDWENLVYIEPRLINAAIAFLLEHQTPEGSFTETEQFNITLDHKTSYKGWSVGGEETGPLVALTALVTVVLHGAAPTLTGDVNANAIKARHLATKFLERQLEHLWEPYELAITTYALTLVASPEKEVAVKMLEAHGRFKDDRMHWSRKEITSNVRLSEDSQRNYLLPKEPQEWDSSAVEATSYALLVFLIREGVTARVEAIMNWLTSVRDWTFAFSGTVDTVVAMSALAEYSYRARLKDLTDLNVVMEATSEPRVVHSVPITNTSITNLRTLQVARPWGHVYLMARGSGQAVAQLEVTWGVDLDRFLKKSARKYFDLNVTETYSYFRNKTVIDITCCFRWTALDVSPTSHATLMEVEVATGYYLSQADSNRMVRRLQATVMPEITSVKCTTAKTFWQFHYVPGDRPICLSYRYRRRYPAANYTAIRSVTIFENFAPEHFETTVINATPLAALDICEVCGSYQCPYCPFYSGDAPIPLPDTRSIALLTTLVCFATRVSNFYPLG